MSFMPEVMSMQAIMLANRSVRRMLGEDTARTALANGVTGKETQQGIAAIAKSDTDLALQAANARMNYEVSQIMLENAQKLQKADMDQKRRMMDNGFLFG